MGNKYTAASLQACFEKFDKKEMSRKEIASFIGVTSQCFGNYLVARDAYYEGREVVARHVNTGVFSEWASKYGGNGEPKYKKEDGTRKHQKKVPVIDQTDSEYIDKLYQTFGKDPIDVDAYDSEHHEEVTSKKAVQQSTVLEFPWEPMARLFGWIKANKVGMTMTPDGDMTLTAKEELFETLFKR